MVLEARLFPYTEARLSCCLSPLVVPCDTGRHTRRLPRHRETAGASQPVGREVQNNAVEIGVRG